MSSILALDVGTVRIGVAVADLSVPIAMPHSTITVDGTEIQQINALVAGHDIERIVVGYPRNQAGEATDQTALVESFVGQLGASVPVVYQDESLTSVMAEDRLKASGKPYQKADIDMMAASIILQDYLEQHHGA